MALTLQEVEDRGLISELAKCFGTRPAALAVIGKLDIEPGEFRPFEAMTVRQWWSDVCRTLDAGLIPDGLNLLFCSAADARPGNALFQDYLEERSRPNNRQGNHGNMILKLPDDISDELALEIIRVARRTVQETGKQFELNIGTPGSSRFHFSIENADEGDIERLRRELEEFGEERGIDLSVAEEPHNFRDYYSDPIIAEGPDGRRFALDDMRASTPVKDVARGVMNSYEKNWPTSSGGGRQQAVVDHVTDEGSARLDPRKTLHDAGVRPGATLRVAPERTAGAIDARMRDEALARARIQVLGHAEANPGFEVDANSLVAPTEYLFRFSAPSFAPPPGPSQPPKPIDQHEVFVALPPDFPIKAPIAWWQTKIFHPNIDPQSGLVCLGPIQEHYVPGLDFGDLCKMLVDIGAYRTYTLTEGYNEDAARWAVSREGQIAIERAGGYSLVGRIITGGLPGRPIKVREVD